MVAALGVLPPHLRRTPIWDQGKEMSRHAEIATALGTTTVFFCDPHSPWQRPTNENTNGILRDWFPKGTVLRITEIPHCRSAKSSSRASGVNGLW